MPGEFDASARPATATGNARAIAEERAASSAPARHAHTDATTPPRAGEPVVRPESVSRRGMADARRRQAAAVAVAGRQRRRDRAPLTVDRAARRRSHAPGGRAGPVVRAHPPSGSAPLVPDRSDPAHVHNGMTSRVPTPRHSRTISLGRRVYSLQPLRIQSSAGCILIDVDADADPGGGAPAGLDRHGRTANNTRSREREREHNLSDAGWRASAAPQQRSTRCGGRGCRGAWPWHRGRTCPPWRALAACCRLIAAVPRLHWASSSGVSILGSRWEY